jgi:hypothetical protein
MIKPDNWPADLRVREPEKHSIAPHYKVEHLTHHPATSRTVARVVRSCGLWGWIGDDQGPLVGRRQYGFGTLQAALGDVVNVWSAVHRPRQVLPPKIYVWRGHKVLRNYSSGLVVVAARDEQAAWDALKTTDERAWWYLRLGHRWITDQADWNRADEDDRTAVDGAPFAPEVFDPVDMPVLVQWGGE